MSQSAIASVELSGKAREIFRGLWAALFYATQRPEPPPRSVLVCSADRLEGATTVACGLAIAGAEQSEGSVALVDLNLRNPSVHRQLGLDAGVGASDVLAGAKPLEEAVQRVEPGRLEVLTIGGQAGRLLEILRTDRLRQFFSQLQARCTHVIVDTAPANQYPDAQVLADVIGRVVLVAHSGQTPREALLAARKRVEAGGGKVAGVVLNMRTYPIPRFLYRRV